MQSTMPSFFQQMRQNILQTAQNGLNKSPFSSAYLFAWSAGVYPLFNPIKTCDEPCKNYFMVTDNKVAEVAEFLDQLHEKGETITFWQLEDLFDVRFEEDWDRYKLIDACRYLFLLEAYNQNFWDSMLTHMTPDSAVNIIIKPFEIIEIEMA